MALVPRLPGAPPEERGTALWDRRAELVDVDQAARMAEQARTALAR